MAIRPKRQYLVMKREERPDLTHLNGRKVGTTGGMLLSDAKEAQDIEQRYGPTGSGRDRHAVVVVPIADRREQRQYGYRVQFTVPELPWHKEAKHGRKSKQAKG